MQIPDEIRKSVVFISYLKKDNIRPLVGTAFFVSKENNDKSKNFVYLITARHIL